MLARWTLHAQPAPPFIQHSFEQRLQLFYQVFSFENNPWAGLGRILRCLRNDRKTLMSTKACYCGKVSPIGKPVDFITILWRQPWEELVPWEPTPWQNSGHHDCSKKAVFLCTTVKLQSCHMLARWTQHAGPSTFQSAFIWAIALVVKLNSFWAGLGRILRCLRNDRKTLMSTKALSLHGWQTAMLAHVGTLNSARWALQHAGVASATAEKHRCPMSTFSNFRGKAFLGKPATITFDKNKDVNSSIKFRL